MTMIRSRPSDKPYKKAATTKNKIINKSQLGTAQLIEGKKLMGCGYFNSDNIIA